MYIWHIYSGNETSGNIFVESKYLALGDSSFLHLCLILLLWSYVLTLGNLAPIKGIWKDAEAPSVSLTHRRWIWKPLGFKLIASA
jgi:hypothetical protein